MGLIVRYKGERFWVKSQKQDRLLLHTMLLKKAQRFGFPQVDKGEFELWVPKNEVEILGDEKELGLENEMI